VRGRAKAFGATVIDSSGSHQVIEPWASFASR
jgi:hypothetical protein